MLSQCAEHWHRYPPSCSVITVEFCFSIVNLAMSSTHSILVMRSPKTEWYWLMYSISHIPMAFAVSALNYRFKAPAQMVCVLGQQWEENTLISAQDDLL
jgi:hypothetical protein